MSRLTPPDSSHLHRRPSASCPLLPLLRTFRWLHSWLSASLCFRRLREAAQGRGEAEKILPVKQAEAEAESKALVLTQFLPGSMQSRIRPNAPDLGVSVRISLVAAGLFILTFESAFREVSRLQAGRSLVSPDQATGLQLALAMQKLSDLQKRLESDHKLEIGLDSATAELRAIW